MPPKLSIAEQLAHSTVRLKSTLANGDVSTGTGFFYQFAKTGDQSVPAIVTNRHVVAGGVRGRFVLTLRGPQGEPLLGQPLTAELVNFELQWVGHPDPDIDLCAMPIAPLLHLAESHGRSAFHISLDGSLVPTDAEMKELDLIEDITMVGYPTGLWDKVNNLPIFRRGSTATHPAVDWNGKPEFLIDAACFPGSSGSPVFLFNRAGYTDKQGNTRLGAVRLKLLGVLHAGPQYLADGEIAIRPVPTAAKAVAQTAVMINLGVVIKSKALAAFDAHFRTTAGSVPKTP